MLALLSATACARQASNDDSVQREPIPLHVVNQNFLDANVFVDGGGTRRRLGSVSGNSSADFLIDWTLADGREITVYATTIGGPGTASSGALSVAYNEAIEFHIGSRLSQSSATVHQR